MKFKDMHGRVFVGPNEITNCLGVPKAKLLPSEFEFVILNVFVDWERKHSILLAVVIELGIKRLWAVVACYLFLSHFVEFLFGFKVFEDILRLMKINGLLFYLFI